MMELPPRDDRRLLRIVSVAVLLLALLGVVAFASRSGFGHHATVARPTPAYVNWAMSVFLVLFVLAIPFAAWSYLQQQRHEDRLQKSFQARVVRGIGILLLVMAFGAAIAWLRRTGHLPSLAQLGFGHGSSGSGVGGKHGQQSPYSPTFQWPVLWATIGLLAAAAAVYWSIWRQRRGALGGREQLEAEPTIAEELAASIGDAIDDLEAEPDPRRAVVAAYARMEAALARGGLEREPSETPLEYLRRILLDLRARADAVQRLTALFEQAKFSSHEIDAAMKREAISSLQAIRSDLQAAPA